MGHFIRKCGFQKLWSRWPFDPCWMAARPQGSDLCPQSGNEDPIGPVNIYLIVHALLAHLRKWQSSVPAYHGGGVESLALLVIFLNCFPRLRCSTRVCVRPSTHRGGFEFYPCPFRIRQGQTLDGARSPNNYADVIITSDLPRFPCRVKNGLTGQA